MSSSPSLLLSLTLRWTELTIPTSQLLTVNAESRRIAGVICADPTRAALEIRTGVLPSW
jgi:hypothetical protein